MMTSSNLNANHSEATEVEEEEAAETEERTASTSSKVLPRTSKENILQTIEEEWKERDRYLKEVAEEVKEADSHLQEATTTSTSEEEAETCTISLLPENMVMAGQATDTDLLTKEVTDTKSNTLMTTMDKELTFNTDHREGSKVLLLE